MLQSELFKVAGITDIEKQNEFVSIAVNISTNDIFELITKAIEYTTDWDAPSICEKTLTKRAVYEVMYKNIEVSKDFPINARLHYIVEFSDFL